LLPFFDPNLIGLAVLWKFELWKSGLWKFEECGLVENSMESGFKFF
jgi:hypothetical protein